jgi:hypothetical protein
MKRSNIIMAAVAALLLGACAGGPEAQDEFVAPQRPASLPAVPAPEAAAPAAPAQVVVLKEAVGPASGNRLADTIGPVTVVVDKDTSYTSGDPVPGADYQTVEFLGQKCLKVKPNARGEIRVAFVLDTPTSLAGYHKLTFKVAGVDGAGGTYNIGLLYTDAKASGERIGSFYVSAVSSTQWTTVEQNLATDEVWGKNFSEDRTLFCLQFWTNQPKSLYIADLALAK